MSMEVSIVISSSSKEDSESHPWTIRFASPGPKLGRAISINDLPIEILSRIFDFGGRNNEDEEGYDNGFRYWDRNDFYRIEDLETSHALEGNDRSPSFRMAVLLVCPHWYQVAISTPSLWTSLRLVSWDSCERLQTILARSRGLPLYVDASHYIEDDEPDTIDAYRFEPEHQSLRPRSRLEQRYIDSFRALAPRFRQLRLEKSHLCWSDPWILSMTNLTTLDLIEADEDVRPSLIQFLALLRSVPALKRLVLRSAGPWDDIELDDEIDTSHGAGDSETPILLPNLTDLVFASYETPAFTTPLLRKLRLPALKTLSLNLSTLFFDYTPLIEQLARPATPSSPAEAEEGQDNMLSRLEYLHIETLSCRDNNAAMEMFYDGLHNLKSLQIYLSDVSTERLHHLLPHTPFGQNTLSVRLPRLETLIISCHTETIALIRYVVEKRKDAGFPLKHLYIKKPDRQHLKWLGENTETFSFF